MPDLVSLPNTDNLNKAVSVKGSFPAFAYSARCMLHPHAAVVVVKYASRLL